MGVGAYLVVPAALLETSSRSIVCAELAEQPVLRRFEGASSTTLEVQTVLWALEDHRTVSAGLVPGNLQVYSDSQCIAGLLKRRTGLTDRGFRARGTDRELRNASLYRRFYELYDELEFEITKVKGHTSHFSRNAMQEVFSYLDRQVRKALRLWLEELGSAGRK
jgi:ribonuclease HI